MKYRREIDGLRALAVIPVIFFHAGFEIFQGGFVGVDVFFVISGYLITSIILTEKQAGTFSLINFYERRARRILPALFFVMTATIPMAWIWLLPQDMKDFSQSLLAVSTFSSNILFWLESGYFDTAAELKPLLHTWSLAVEEQFYMLFPLLLMLTWRLGTKWIVLLLTCIAIASLIAAHWGAYNLPGATFYLLITRAWELLIGSLLAFHMMHRDINSYNSPFNQTASFIGLALILFSVFAYSKSTPFPSLYALAPTIGTGLIILYSTQTTFVGQLLGSKIFVGIGLISYSAYLWHQPLFVFARHNSLTTPNASTMLILSLTAIFIAYISWKYVERPFRNKTIIKRKPIFLMATLGSCLFFTIGAAGHFSNGFESIYSATLDERQQKILATEKTREGYKTLQKENFSCHFHTVDITTSMTKKFSECYETHGEAIIILGDSHAVDLFNAISLNSDHPFIVGISKGGCRPHTPSSDCHYQNFISFAEQNSNKIKTVFYTQAGSYLVQNEEGKTGGRGFFQKESIPLYNKNEELITLVIRYLEKIARHSKVVWLGPRIEPHQNAKLLKRYAIQCKKYNININPNITNTFKQLDRYIDSKISNKTISYFSLIKAINFDADQDMYDCFASYWSDGDHWNTQGETHFGMRIIPNMQKAGHL